MSAAPSIVVPVFDNPDGLIDRAADRDTRRAALVQALSAAGANVSGGPFGGALGGSSGRSDVFPVPAPLAAVLPRGGLPRGGVISLTGREGASSMLLTLLAAVPESWSALVGLPGVGLAAAAELGVDLGRIAVIPDPGSDVLHILSVLADGVDLIATASPANGRSAALANPANGRSAALPPARLRVLTGRLRQHGAVLLVMGRWPGADLTLTVTGTRWSGLGFGFGRLRDRELDIEVSGRRVGAPRSATLLLRADRTSVSMDFAPTSARLPGVKLPGVMQTSPALTG